MVRSAGGAVLIDLGHARKLTGRVYRPEQGSPDEAHPLMPVSPQVCLFELILSHPLVCSRMLSGQLRQTCGYLERWRRRSSVASRQTTRIEKLAMTRRE